MNCPDRPVGRLLEPRAPAAYEPDPYCDFCGRPKCRGDCTEKRQAVTEYVKGLSRAAEDIDADPVVGLADEEVS